MLIFNYPKYSKGGSRRPRRHQHPAGSRPRHPRLQPPPPIGRAPANHRHGPGPGRDHGGELGAAEGRVLGPGGHRSVHRRAVGGAAKRCYNAKTLKRLCGSWVNAENS